MVAVVQRTLKSSNPVISRIVTEGQIRLKTAPAGDLLVQPVLKSDRHSTGQELLHRRPTPGLPPLVTGDLLTLDAVVRRAAAALAVAVAAAGLTWVFRPADLRIGYPLAGALGLVAALLTVVQCLRRTPSSAFTALAFALTEGAFLGLLSGAMSLQTASGAFVQATLGTMAASAGVMIAYLARLIRMKRRFSGYAAAGFLGAVLLAGADGTLTVLLGPSTLGFHSAGTWTVGVLCGLAGVLLATPAMSIHVQRIEQMIAQGAPSRMAWSGAFGLTLTLTWLYVEVVRTSTLLGEESVWL